MSPRGRLLWEAVREGVTISDALRWASQLLRPTDGEEAHIVAELLLCQVLVVNRSSLYARLYSPLAEEERAHLQRLVDRRLAGEPIAYITGLKEFYSSTIKVDRRALIPRPETEALVDRSLKIIGQRPLSVADIGTGSGAIAVSLAINAPQVKIYATDLSSAALELAGENARLHRVVDRVVLLCGDLLEPLPCPVDLIVANLPYVPDDEAERLPTGIRHFEPPTALRGGEDGLLLYRRLFAAAPAYLRTGGVLLCELGWEQVSPAMELARTVFPYAAIQPYHDFAGYERGLEIAT